MKARVSDTKNQLLFQVIYASQLDTCIYLMPRENQQATQKKSCRPEMLLIRRDEKQSEGRDSSPQKGRVDEESSGAITDTGPADLTKIAGSNGMVNSIRVARYLAERVISRLMLRWHCI